MPDWTTKKERPNIHNGKLSDRGDELGTKLVDGQPIWPQLYTRLMPGANLRTRRVATAILLR